MTEFARQLQGKDGNLPLSREKLAEEELRKAAGDRLGPEYRQRRLLLLAWACGILDGLPLGPPKDRIRQVALQLPLTFGTGPEPALVAR